jgi:GrpB-like predicted nucleotidyltransferase (UPF0157 family)
MLGLEKGFVRLLPHDEHWHQSYAEEKALLQNAIGEFILDIQHIGSTSLCGIAAKPILDIAIAIKDKSAGEKCIKPLEDLGYEYRGENGIVGRFYFVRGEPRTHHLHMLLGDGEPWKNHLLFRDYLRGNLDVAKEYDELKRNLAREYPNNRDAYLDGKNEFVEKILKSARLKESKAHSKVKL